MSSILELPPNIVDSIQNAIERSRNDSDDFLYADLLISETSSTFQISNFVVKFHVLNSKGHLEVDIGDGELSFIKPSSSEDDLNLLLATWMLSTSASRFDSVTLSTEGTVSKKRIEYLTDKLAGACRNRQSQEQMKTSKLYLKLDIREDLLLDVLTLFDPDTLEVIHLVSNVPNINGISNTEQWKNCNKVLIDKTNNIPIRAFLHVQQFATMVDVLKPENVWECIQTFIKRNSPREAFFHIQTTTPIDASGIMERESGAKTEQVSVSVEGFASRFLHTLQLEMSSPDLIFVVLIADNEISGVSCHIDHVDEDCEILFSELLAE